MIWTLLNKPEHHSASHNSNHVEVRKLDMDFKEMIISYHDDEQRIRSELFKVPNPKLCLSIVDFMETDNDATASSFAPTVDVSLTGELF